MNQLKSSLGNWFMRQPEYIGIFEDLQDDLSTLNVDYLLNWFCLATFESNFIFSVKKTVCIKQ